MGIPGDCVTTLSSFDGSDDAATAGSEASGAAFDDFFLQLLAGLCGLFFARGVVFALLLHGVLPEVCSEMPCPWRVRVLAEGTAPRGGVTTAFPTLLDSSFLASFEG